MCCYTRLVEYTLLSLILVFSTMFTQIAKFIDRFFNHVIDKNRYKPNILDCNKTVDLILQKRMSIARYGDGEFSMMLGRKENIGFQQIDDNLSFHLQAVFEHPDSNVLICIPKVFDWKDRFLMNRTGRRFWSRYLKRQSIGFLRLRA